MSALPAWDSLSRARPILSIRGLRKTFARGLARAAPRTVALEAVDLDVARGDILAVFGNEGSGKTTLLQCACGLLRRDAGAIAWHGEAFNGGGCHPGIGYVPAVPVYYPFLTPRDVLAFRIARDSAAQSCDARALDEVITVAGLESCAGESISRLSRELIRRVAIAEAMACGPEVLMIDTSCAESIPERVIARVASRGTAIVVAVRDCTTVASVATKLVRLEDGRATRTFSVERPLMFVAEQLH